MSFLNDIADSLAPHLPLALAAVSLLFALGGIALVLVRSPAHRQRIGELTLAAALGWLVLAAIPLPRWLPVGDDAKSADPIPLNSSTTAIQPRWLETARRAHQRDAGISPIRGSSFETSANSRHGEPIDPMLAQHNSDAPAPISSAQPVSQDAAIAVERPSGPLADSATTQIDFQAHDSILAGSDAVSRDTAIATKLQASQPRRDLQWLSVAAFAYLIGVALATIWLLLGHGLLMRERFTAAAPAAWLYRLSHNAVSQWEGRLPRLVVSRRASRPLSWGVWRPIICLPDRICHTANRDQLRPILLHELGHIRRGDARGNLLFELAFPLLFFHPLYWWLRAQVRMAAELVADDWAAHQTGKEVYVAQLVALARGPGRRQVLLAGTGVFSSPSQFYRRMQMLLARENSLATRPSRSWRIASAAGLVIAVVIAAALAGNRPAAGQQKDQPAKEPPKSVSAETPKATESEAPKAENNAGPKLPGGDTPKSDAVPIEIESAPAAGALPSAKDVPAASASADAAPVTTAPAAEPAAGLPSRPAAGPLPTTPPAADRAVGLGSSLAGGQPGAIATELAPRSADSSSEDAATAARLRAEKAKLLDEIQALRAKLHALDAAKTEAGGVARYPAALPSAERARLSADRLVILTRADEKGHLHEEVWTTDENGRPSRIVKKTEKTGDSPITATTAGISDSDLVVKMLKDKDGRFWFHTYDAKTGKLIESRELASDPLAAPADAPRTADPTRRNPAPAAKYPPSAGTPNSYPPVLIARTPDNGATNVSDRPIDLITLATSYADAVGAVEMAKAKLAEAESGGRGGQTSELRSSRAALENAVRKEKLLRRIAEVATAGAKQNYDRLVKLHGQGAVSADVLDESKSRLDILSQILDSRGDAPPESTSAVPK